MIYENTGNINVELNNKIRELQFHYHHIAETCLNNAQNGPPEFVYFYNDIFQSFSDASTSCENYFLHKNILQFCKEQLDLGFFYEVNKLKRLIQEPNVLEQFCDILKNYDNDELSEGERSDGEEFVC